MRVRWLKSLASIVFPGLWILSLSTRAAQAFEPDPDFWYIETVTLDEASLPPDFHVFNGEGTVEQLSEGVWLSTNRPETSLLAMIYLINRSDEAVYILSLEYRDRLIMETPDAAYEARLRGAHEVASYLVRPNSGETFALTWEALKDLDDSLKDLNPPTFNPQPSDLTPPEAQHSELLMVYGEQVVLLPFTISYAINANYEIEEYLGPAGVPEPTGAPEEKKGFDNPGTFVGVVGGIGLAALITWLVWRRRNER